MVELDGPPVARRFRVLAAGIVVLAALAAPPPAKALAQGTDLSGGTIVVLRAGVDPELTAAAFASLSGGTASSSIRARSRAWRWAA